MMLQAVGAAADPASGGRQMPSHWSDPAADIVTGSSRPARICAGGGLRRSHAISIPRSARSLWSAPAKARPAKASSGNRSMSLA